MEKLRNFVNATELRNVNSAMKDVAVVLCGKWLTIGVTTHMKVTFYLDKPIVHMDFIIIISLPYPKYSNMPRLNAAWILRKPLALTWSSVLLSSSSSSFCWWSSHAVLVNPWSPLENFSASTAICSQCYMGCLFSL